jgi:transcriptional regulator with XRE-family HTH domain
VPDRPTPAAYVRAADLLGRKVYELRRDRDLTQEGLSDLSGISRNQIQNIEHSRNNQREASTGHPGPGNARLDTVFRLAYALKVDVTYLVDPEREVFPLPDTRR